MQIILLKQLIFKFDKKALNAMWHSNFLSVCPVYVVSVHKKTHLCVLHIKSNTPNVQFNPIYTDWQELQHHKSTNYLWELTTKCKTMTAEFQTCEQTKIE